jgi:hypothetical protein
VELAAEGAERPSTCAGSPKSIIGRYDPHQHQACKWHDSDCPGTVVDVSRGLLINDRVLRPRLTVAKDKADTA